LNALLKHHAGAISEELSAIRSELTAVFASVAAKDSLESEPASVTATVTALVTLTNAINADLGQSFAASTGNTGPSTIASRSFWRTLHRAEALASAVLQERVQP
jgi:hypothetical protein